MRRPENPESGWSTARLVHYSRTRRGLDDKAGRAFSSRDWRRTCWVRTWADSPCSRRAEASNIRLRSAHSRRSKASSKLAPPDPADLLLLADASPAGDPATSVIASISGALRLDAIAGNAS